MSSLRRSIPTPNSVVAWVAILAVGFFVVLVVTVAGSTEATPSSGQSIEIRVDSTLLHVGEPIRLEVSGAQWLDRIVLRGESRPGSIGAQPIEAPWVPARGFVDWTPTRAGLARWVVTDLLGETLAVRDLAIAPAGVPASGVVILLVAGGLLFGGAGLGLLAASGQDQEMSDSNS